MRNSLYTEAVTIPVMAKARIGHFVEAQILESIGIDYIDESFPVVHFFGGGVATLAIFALMMQLGCDGVFVGSGLLIFFR
ncbi:hypothetical protein IFM89_009533 [Coptis chinensis]|uniref:PdxS/SNZ N-terminal domain-containing protein n=1 Tax=Coptis chinensis TaxID=261450 RepID=A0A835HV28_9MAGN|nr:hypothetical protein IFM89_009533 [Coptis chinensis]